MKKLLQRFKEKIHYLLPGLLYTMVYQLTGLIPIVRTHSDTNIFQFIDRFKEKSAPPPTLMNTL